MDIEVSVICNAYNHEPYIRDALEGFVNQITDFKFEVLVHDDASTDGTASIIREYEEKYPDIIKPIYQTENQYSQGISIGYTYQHPRVKGKYVAFCEGDDYWTDRHKLQKQYNILEENDGIDMCVHAAKQVDGITGEFQKEISPRDKDGLLSLKDVISGGGAYIATASILYRKQLIDDPPEFRKAYGIDYTLQVMGAMRGGIYFLADVMSVYRFLTPNSFTLTLRKDYARKIRHKKKMRKALRLMDKETDRKFHGIIMKFLIKNYIVTAILHILDLLPQKKVSH